ncbi:lytic transglycosylase domain-containing protein [Ensifer sp. Root31]|uniref:lytic transglycosylase domain-containing protein n=1 Tax=Ensifer sp. Root31 TaxID=1736512 RepID=UPI0009EAEC2A|nr:lytic transglycosylase domain-containing protein [Ensifer sp. Root31]
MRVFRKTKIGVFIRESTITFAVIYLVQLHGVHSTVHAAIFDELKDGTLIQRDGGAQEGAPPTGVSSGPYEASVGYMVPDASFRSDMNALTGNAASKAISRQMILPAPRGMSRRLSIEQQRMRLVAAEVALAFASMPAVRRAGLDKRSFVELFTAMIQRESGFNQFAVSSAGARGLGQLMPATAAELGVCDSFSAADNLQGAATYLTNMLSQFGSPELALAAYNAGPGAVERHRGIPPYRETRQYVADILHAVTLTSNEVPVDFVMERQPTHTFANRYLVAGKPPSDCPTLAPSTKSGPTVYQYPG